MDYHSPAYLFLFLPAVMLFYNIMPQKHRWKALLISSYAFYFVMSGKLVVYLLFTTIAIHYFGIWLTAIENEREKKSLDADRDLKKQLKAEYKKKQRYVLLVAVLVNIGILLCLKYAGFFSLNINSLFKILSLPIKIPTFKFALPLGISFYTLQAISYVADIYLGNIKADRNIGRLALFMSFFPQIMEGPICRYSQTAQKLYLGEKITYSSMTFGAKRILWGLFKKMIIADRLNILVKTVFNDYPKYNGTVIFIGMLCYTCQLYMDFSGSIDMVIGSGEIFGLKLPENFRQPFFSKTASEFWQRWHITLGAWFKDYIFYPVSLSKPLKKLTAKGRKYLGNHFGPLIAGAIALFFVWLANGLWHGAAWNYIFFGMYYFVLILLSNITEPFTKKLCTLLHINRNVFVFKLFQILRTVLIVNVGELFFRANGLQSGLTMFKKMITEFNLTTFYDGTLTSLGIDLYDYGIVIIAVLVVLFVSILHEKGISVREKLKETNIFLRWAVYYGGIFSVIIFGAYGVGYIPVDILYAAF